MKSKAAINGHPVHPILVTFPIAFFTGTLLFDVLAILYPQHHLSQTARYLNIGGIMSVVFAAIPGIVDYIYVVPPQSSAKKRATSHALINTTVTLLFILSLVLRSYSSAPFIIIGIELVAMVLLGIAGWMGGKLVFNNQIGVENRYANKGRWNETRIKQKTGKILVATATELQTDQMKLLHINGKRIIIAKTKDEFVAFNDHCTHKGGSLAGGIMICDTVQCPWHGSQFNVRTGEAITGPATKNINTYKTTTEDGKIYLLL